MISANAPSVPSSSLETNLQNLPSDVKMIIFEMNLLSCENIDNIDAVIEYLRVNLIFMKLNLNKQVMQAAKKRIHIIYKQQLEKANRVPKTNPQYQEQTLFHLAAIHVNKKENFHFLLNHCRQYMDEQDKDICAQDHRGNTPLHYACSQNFNFKIAKQLIGAGARLNSAPNRKNETAKRVLEKERFPFAFNKSYNILKYLIEGIGDGIYSAQNYLGNGFFASMFSLSAWYVGMFGAGLLVPLLFISSFISISLFIKVKCSLLGGYELYCSGKKHIQDLIHLLKSHIAVTDAGHKEEFPSSTTIAMQALSSCENPRAVTSSAPPLPIESHISIRDSAPLSANPIVQPASDEGVARLSF